MQFGVREGQTIFDLSIKTYGLDNIYKLIQENGIESINATLVSGQVITYDETFVIPSAPDVSPTQRAVVSSIKTFTGRENQSVYDLCLMAYGSLDNLYKLIQDSNIDNTNERSFYQKIVTYDENFTTDKIFYERVIKAGTIINTGPLSNSSSYVDSDYVDSGYVD